MKRKIIFLLLFFNIFKIYSQESGFSFLQFFSAKEYLGHPQNWAIIQDKRGIMYLGTSTGITEFDGTFFRNISITNNSVVRSFAMDSAGRIYVGAFDEFGYLKPNKFGEMQYFSISANLDSTLKNFADIWKIKIINDKIYFCARKILFRYSIEKQKIEKFWKPENYFQLIEEVDNQLFVGEKNKGLFILKNDSLFLIKNSQPLNYLSII